MQSLKEELRDYDEQLPCWSAELAAAEEWAQQVDSEADAAEAEHRQLTEELSEMRLTSISPASSACEKDFEAAVGHHQKMGIAHDDFDEPLPIPPSTSDGLNLDEHRRHVDRHLQQEGIPPKAGGGTPQAAAPGLCRPGFGSRPKGGRGTARGLGIGGKRRPGACPATPGAGTICCLSARCLCKQTRHPPS